MTGALMTEPLRARPQEPVRAPERNPSAHFDAKGKPPSRFTLEVLRKQQQGLPFADKRDFDEQKKGFIAAMPDLKIMADAGHVAWDMERFQT
jgi:alkyl sulfatase BDS1-like metallo-beta-lactamase superfamily hydrolase